MVMTRDIPERTVERLAQLSHLRRSEQRSVRVGAHAPQSSGEQGRINVAGNLGISSRQHGAERANIGCREGSGVGPVAALALMPTPLKPSEWTVGPPPASNDTSTTLPPVRGRSSRTLVVGLLIVAPLLAFYVSLFVGRFGVSPVLVLEILASSLVPFVTVAQDPSITVVLDVRLPRVLLALLAGAALSTSGPRSRACFVIRL